MHVDFKYELPSPWLQNPCSVVQYMEVPETPIFILPQSNFRSVPDVCGPGDLYYQTEDTDRRKFSGEKLDAYEQESKRFKASQTKLSIGFVLFFALLILAVPKSPPLFLFFSAIFSLVFLIFSSNCTFFRF